VEAFLSILPDAVREQVLRAIADGGEVIEGERVPEIVEMLPAQRTEGLLWLKEMQASAPMPAEGEEEALDE
jgi:hypothetical protein